MHSYSNNWNQSAYITVSISPKMTTFTCYQFINRTHNSKRLGGEIDTTNEIKKNEIIPSKPCIFSKVLFYGEIKLQLSKIWHPDPLTNFKNTICRQCSPDKQMLQKYKAHRRENSLTVLRLRCLKKDNICFSDEERDCEMYQLLMFINSYWMTNTRLIPAFIVVLSFLKNSK